ncbi:nicotinamide riboside transporter PnuC [Psychroflexus maritimus]|uniref:Nicotinamide riboside transporter PnuC n=1 Tax=Psychroflexus maritimus TaxID=2714865 RepID=A0A967DZ61_9FLAO|nr:nicotinamide riboside transporter PnuC [Psychroflexus maritimus]NGZ90575.1 nicotinamide mononucleotide transporter [Psychroflexus maritimus]
MDLLEILFQPYQKTPLKFIVLEGIAVVFGLLSVVFSKRDNILVFPSGMISTLIFVYLLWEYQLIGDLMINSYYFIMSIYGWIVWTRKVDNTNFIPITKINASEWKKAIAFFMSASVFTILIYFVFGKWENWISAVDVLTTAIFFVGMWLMAKKKIENWIFWIIGDLISVPLYVYKGLYLSSIQYLIFTLIALLAYQAWKKKLNKPQAKLLK